MPEPEKELLCACTVSDWITECVAEIVEGEALAELFNLVCSGHIEYIGDSMFEFTPAEGG